MNKKLLAVLLLVVSIFIAGCTADEPEVEEVKEEIVVDTSESEVELENLDLKLVVPFGSPSLALSSFILETTDVENATLTTEVVNGVDPLVTAFTSGSHDVIVAPNNLGAKLVNTGLEYTYVGSVVYGNLYIASSNTEVTLDDLEGKEIVAFGQNATPDVALQKVLKGNELLDKVTIRYVGSVSDAQVELLSGQAEFALLAEPILSVTKTKLEVGTINLQDEWKALTGASSYPQAGVFVKNDIVNERPDIIESLVENLKSSVTYANENPETVASDLVAAEFGLPEPIIKSAIPNSNLMFVGAEESREALELYFNEIINLNAALIGGNLPSDDFYYKK